MEQVLEARLTGAGVLWKALWALIFGYIISAGIQVLVTREQMAKVLGGRGPRQAGLASFGRERMAGARTRLPLARAAQTIQDWMAPRTPGSIRLFHNRPPTGVSC